MISNTRYARRSNPPDQRYLVKVNGDLVFGSDLLESARSVFSEICEDAADGLSAYIGATVNLIENCRGKAVLLDTYPHRREVQYEAPRASAAFYEVTKDGDVFNKTPDRNVALLAAVRLQAQYPLSNISVWYGDVLIAGPDDT